MAQSIEKPRCIYKIVNGYDNMIYFGVSSNNDIYNTLCAIRIVASHHVDKTSKLIRHMRALGHNKFRIESVKEYKSITKEKIVELMFKIMSEYNPAVLLNTTVLKDSLSNAQVKRFRVISTKPTVLNGKIYKIINTADNKVFIGMTTNKYLSNALGSIKASAQTLTRTSKLHTHMRLIGVQNFSVVLIKEHQWIYQEDLDKAIFAEINKRDPSRILNTNTEHGKRCEEHNKKLGRSLKGSKHPRFKRGSILHLAARTNNPPCVSFTWIDHSNIKSKQMRRTWQISKYGIEEALRLAREHQDTIYPIITL